MADTYNQLADKYAEQLSSELADYYETIRSLRAQSPKPPQAPPAPDERGPQSGD